MKVFSSSSSMLTATQSFWHWARIKFVLFERGLCTVDQINCELDSGNCRSFVEGFVNQRYLRRCDTECIISFEIDNNRYSYRFNFQNWIQKYDEFWKRTLLWFDKATLLLYSDNYSRHLFPSILCTFKWTTCNICLSTVARKQQIKTTRNIDACVLGVSANRLTSSFRECFDNLF